MFTINFQNSIPLNEQLENNVCELIAQGVIAQGEKIPTIREVAKKLGVNPNTVSKAYQNLERKGIIFTAVGRGSFVSGDGGAGENTAQNILKNEALDDFENSAKNALRKNASPEELQVSLDKVVKNENT